MMKAPLATTISSALLSSLIFLPTLGYAADGGYRSAESAVERELPRRYDYLRRGEEAVEKGDKAMKDKDYATAFAQYKLAVDLIPNSANSARAYHRALDIVVAAGKLTFHRALSAETALRETNRGSENQGSEECG